MLFSILLVVLVFLFLFAFTFFYSSFSWGFVMYKFWAWFLIPAFAIAFPDLVVNQITYPLAVGLYLFTTFFKTQTVQVIKEEYLKNDVTVWGTIFAPWITLLIGWLIKIVLF